MLPLWSIDISLSSSRWLSYDFEIENRDSWLSRMMNVEESKYNSLFEASCDRDSFLGGGGGEEI